MDKGNHISYANALKMILDEFPEKCSYTKEDIENYISAFSFYLSLGDDAYRYHTAFLVQKNSNFQRFLRRAKEKKERLNILIEKFRQCEKIKQWWTSFPAQAKEVDISIDDFLRSTLSGDISFCKEVSIEGAEQGKNIITIYFGGRTASFFDPVSKQEMERAENIFLSLVTNENKGGEDNDIEGSAT